MSTSNPDGSLAVIALVSGGKDSFFSILHCLEQGHRIVALANLYPPPSTTRLTPVGEHGALQDHAAKLPATSSQEHDSRGMNNAAQPEETDLNSFMYQTVGHQTIPLYAEATGLPLYRQQIHGTAVHHSISYTPGGHSVHQKQKDGSDTGPLIEDDETESLLPLLRAVLKAHPEANAVSTGAILSTYQRTRVESVCIRLGLVPLGYLWQYPDLPRALPDPAPDDSLQFEITPSRSGEAANTDDAQLLRDMARTGLEARIIKVASAGLDEGILWENVASEKGIARIQRGLRKFGGGGKGAVLGEGGEFETLVVDGPPELFKGRIVVREDDRRVVREGGGSEWLLIREPIVEMKTDPFEGALPKEQRSVAVPALLDQRFEYVLNETIEPSQAEAMDEDSDLEDAAVIKLPPGYDTTLPASSHLVCFHGDAGLKDVESQTQLIVGQIRDFLSQHSLQPTSILNSIIVLRHMSDFPAINKLYGSLFMEANPPSRVTISCGDRLSHGCLIAVYLRTQTLARTEDRKGLHVQSRSYWAPANIGPYSQAISYPLISSTTLQDGSSSDSSSNLAVSIAGQIPLIPATMEFPPSKPVTDVEQITLALQHLWRVGTVMDVQWWSSAVAYFPTTKPVKVDGDGGMEIEDDAGEEFNSEDASLPAEDIDEVMMQKNSIAAATAWRHAHLYSSKSPSDESDDEGPDLWDRRYNSQYQSYGGDESSAQKPQLPHWDVHRFLPETQAEKMQSIPFVFSAEVEQLPRSACVEWHAHIGLSNIAEGAVQMRSSTTTRLSGIKDLAGTPQFVDLHQVAVTTPKGVYLHTTAVLGRSEANWVVPRGSLAEVLNVIAAAVSASIRNEIMKIPLPAEGQETVAGTVASPYLIYADQLIYSNHSSPADISAAMIPCHSLWNGEGQRLGVVALFETAIYSSSASDPGVPEADDD